MNSNSVDNSLLGIPLFSSFLSSLFIIISVRWEVKIQCKRSRINNWSPRGGSYGSKAREQCTCHGNTRQYHSGACTVTHIDYHVDSDTFVSTSIFQAICGLRGETSGAWVNAESHCHAVWDAIPSDSHYSNFSCISHSMCSLCTSTLPPCVSF